MSKSALGRGLGALLTKQPFANKATPPTSPFQSPPDSSASTAPSEAASADSVLRVDVSRIHPSALQPRRDFPQESLAELADSIREQGILQPLVVRKDGDSFELIAGERRWRASQLVGLKQVPIIVREANDTTVLEWMLIENLQREGLNPIEEAKGYAQLVEQFSLRQEDVATKVGRSRVAVANALRLLRLPSELQIHLRENRLSVGHAKVLLGLDGPETQTLAAERVIRENLNVRQTEQLVAAMQQKAAAGSIAPKGATTSKPQDAHLADLVSKLQERLGTKVGLRYSKGKGAVEIKFFNDDDLQRILDALGIKPD